MRRYCSSLVEKGVERFLIHTQIVCFVTVVIITVVIITVLIITVLIITVKVVKSEIRNRVGKVPRNIFNVLFACKMSM